MFALIYDLFIWVIIPGVMLSIVVFSVLIFNLTKGQVPRMSAFAGLMAGFLLFSAYGAATFIPGFVDQYLSYLRLPGGIPFLLGFIIGIIIPFLAVRLRPTRFVGIITLALSFTGLAALFSYLLTAIVKDTMMFLALGIAAGIFICAVFFSKLMLELIWGVPLYPISSRPCKKCGREKWYWYYKHRDWACEYCHWGVNRGA